MFSRLFAGMTLGYEEKTYAGVEWSHDCACEGKQSYRANQGAISFSLHICDQRAGRCLEGEPREEDQVLGLCSD